MQELLDRWDTLKKALNHSSSVAKIAAPKIEEPETIAHPDNLSKVKYGLHNIPGNEEIYGEKGDTDDKIGVAKIKGQHYIVRHGAAAHRTDVEHQMSKLLGADHMLPNQEYDHGLNHTNHHNQETFFPHAHAGSSFQEHSPGEQVFRGKDGYKDNTEEGTEFSNKLREHWKNGDLHKLWALHYISNNADMHSGNFNVGKDGIKAFDSDHAFYELPTAHVIHHHQGEQGEEGTHELHYMPYAQSQLPSYLSPFIDKENDEGIEPRYKDDQVHVGALNEHAKNINPDLFEQFGPHAAERARKAKKALMSADPTTEMRKLWEDHSDKTGDLKWNKTSQLNQEKKKPAA